ncbi:MAG: ShlB/FhaC/HecB family hemolysin secretion/activation protein [Planctomycetota bacterium]|nr:ShlB/FhaC/HecB family hemolysin secretion/activation protein [Planctomycetota bacterium]
MNDANLWEGRRAVRALRRRWALTCAGTCCVTLAAFGQAGDPPPIDINAVQPGADERAPGTPPPTPADAPAGAEAPEEIDDGAAYPVSRFVLEYKSDHPQHPALEEVARAVVKLGVTPEGYVRWREGLPSVEMHVDEVHEGAGAMFRRSAIDAVALAIVEELAGRGLIAVVIDVHPEDADWDKDVDKRAGARSEFRLIVATFKIGQVRTLASGERLREAIEADPAARVDNPDAVQLRVRTQSPLQKDDLLDKDVLDNYVARLNRHPGRRVDIALSPGGDGDKVVLDYLVSEGKPWSIYAQLSNTGTESTSEWRQRFGFIHNQLTGSDDILRVDYTTAGFDASHAALVSYDFPVLSDVVRVRTYGSYTEFTASDVGAQGLDFNGRTWTVGGEIVGTVWQRRASFIDAYAGVRWKSEQVDTPSSSVPGDENFLIPYIGVRYERFTEQASSVLDLGLEAQWEALSGLDPENLQDLGRPDVSDSWELLKFAMEHSFYLEPLINPRGYRGDPSAEGPRTLAHELSLSVRGQYAFGYRVVASEQDVAGGLYTVRGYPESVVAGDSIVVGSLEYRLHVPRALGVSNESGRLAGREVGLFGPDFRWQPQQDFGQADWDFIVRGFVDAARTRNNPAENTTEQDDTLVGVGLGAELQWRRNVTLRMDWGVALTDVESTTDGEFLTEAGDNRFHFLLSVLY